MILVPDEQVARPVVRLREILMTVKRIADLPETETVPKRRTTYENSVVIG